MMLFHSLSTELTLELGLGQHLPALEKVKIYCNCGLQNLNAALLHFLSAHRLSISQAGCAAQTITIMLGSAEKEKRIKFA